MIQKFLLSIFALLPLVLIQNQNEEVKMKVSFVKKVELIRLIEVVSLVGTLSVMLIFNACSQKLISREEALNSCRETYKLYAKEDTSKMRFEMKPEHPISLDSFQTGAVKTLWLNDSLKILERAGEKLKNRIFWRCQCWLFDEADTEYEIYIDAETHEILHVDGLDADEWWTPKM